ncbi:predicted protein [Histoplasma capsulatum G186AR]|uniref:Uncharacterized protein n=1 Tax=Ajellomyces capsulatus (strain G186AR / H82 / ATCC MYA-2454 / RMSCC 2432) TaxID=447093 RepID=C0NTQ0_AJECG|nr:uncharacterized protein HCBG_06530 [Histoplasma capsulatum G186AR]EEH05411.1 predicted protein [Histoplasma capsulatum G186AR]
MSRKDLLRFLSKPAKSPRLLDPILLQVSVSCQCGGSYFGLATIPHPRAFFIPLSARPP